jgi:DNA modification methylase
MEQTMKIGSAKIIRGNALDLPIPDSSVDLIVTSPPYFALRSYQDSGEHYEGQIGGEATPHDFVEALLKATQEMIRVLKPEGSIWVNLGDKFSRGSRPRNQPDQFRKTSDITFEDERYLKDTAPENSGIPGKSLMGIPWRYAIKCVDDLGLILRSEVIWAKPNGMPESVTDRVRRSHEQWFHFTKEARYFCDINKIRQAYTSAPAKAQKSKFTESGQSKNPGLALQHDLQHNSLGKLPGSVWTIPTEPLKIDPELGIDHFAAFPTEWPRRIILGFCPENGTVLDPFSGTGTTAGVAKALGRTGIGIDMSADYCRLAEWRTNGGGFQKLFDKVTRQNSNRKQSKKPSQSQLTLMEP